MWPGDFIDWSRKLYPYAFKVARDGLLWRNNDPGFQADLPDLAQRARYAAFELARRHRDIPGYFANFDEYRFWVFATIAQQAIRLYLLHPAAKQRLTPLPLWKQRLVRLVYVDRLMESEVATLLAISATTVQSQAVAALALV